MSGLDLSDKERLMLANQYEILGLLQDEGPDGENRMWAETLRSGNKWLYDQLLERISPVLSDAKADFVLSVMEMYAALQSGYDRLEDKSGIEARQIEFEGFDGNNESEYLSFTEDLVRHRRYKHVLGDYAINSHGHTKSVYGRMVQQWEQLGRPVGEEMDKAAMESIVAARIHPDHR